MQGSEDETDRSLLMLDSKSNTAVYNYDTPICLHIYHQYLTVSTDPSANFNTNILPFLLDKGI